MRTAVGVVREWEVIEADTQLVMNAASLVKQVIAQVALALLDDLEVPVRGDITVQHVLTHTTGLPNWRPDGDDLRPLRPPGQRWGYSGEGFVLLQSLLERRAGTSIDELVDDLVFGPLEMSNSFLAEPEPGYHGYRPLMTTASDYAHFLAASLRRGDTPFHHRWLIDDELAWSAGWGLQHSDSLWCWQWGLNDDAANFVIGCPTSGDGVVVLTDDAGGHDFYRSVIRRELPGDHATMRLDQNKTWRRLLAT